MMQLNEAPEKYWDFAAEYNKFHFGETPDLSVFHFLFYDKIHYLEPNVTFSEPICCQTNFLGIAGTAAGDAFIFYILTKSEKGRDMS